VVGCGGSCPCSCPRTADEASASSGTVTAPEPKETEAEPGGAASEHEEPPAAPKEAKTDEAPAPDKNAESKADAAPEPQFPDHASVSQAISAIPRGSARANIDPDALAEPLQNQSVYEPCKVGAQHFKVKVAVWDGKAVGVDVATPNKKLAECIDSQIRAIEWRQRVRSLNTVEYSL
jgi:hypothetical protein